MRTGKRRIASGIAACMIALSTAFTGVGQREVKAADISVSEYKGAKTVLLKGKSVVIEDVGGGKVSFYADEDKDGVKDSNNPIRSDMSNISLSNGYIVGADTESGSSPSYRITVNGGNIGTLYGENGVSPSGPVRIDINGGTISTFYAINNGSPDDANSDNDITINLKGGTISNFNLATPASDTSFSVYVNNETGQTINGTSGCGYMNELSSGITVSGNYVMKKTMSISKKLTVTSGSTMKIPSGKSFTTGGVIANSGVIKCEGSFTKTGSNKALGQIWFKNLPTLEGDISSYISTSGNSICFPLTMTNASDANGLCQLLTVTANPESVAAGEWAKLTKPSFYVKAGSQFTASVASNEYNYTNDKINQFYCTGDSSTTKTDLEKITGGFRGTMPSEPATLYVSLSDPVAKQDPILGSAPKSLNAVEGQTLGDIYPNGTLNLNGTPGTFNWIPVPTTSVGAVGTKEFQMKFVPDNPNLYNTKTFYVSVTVAAATNTCTTHTYGSAYKSDSTGHWQVCTNCGQATEKTGHTLTSTVTQRATSTTLGSIQRSCTVCGGIVSTESISRTSFTKVTTMDAVEGQVLGNLSLPVNGGSTPGTYSWVSGNSTSVGTEGTHVFSIRFTPTDTVKYAPEDFEVAVVVTKAHTHDYSVRNKDASGHWYECECGEKDSSTFSVHSYIMNKNSYGHWNECECGYKTSVSSHSNTTAAITRKASSTRKGTITTTCDACGYVIATEDIEKTDFGLAGTITALTEDTLGDLTIPDNSGSTPGAFSWVSSASTSVGSVGTHTFKMRFTPNDQTRYEIEEFDVSVTVSERHTHSYVIRDYDSINHWFKCSCGEKNTASSESHTYETKCNEQGHWKECFCGYRTDTVAHSKTTAVITKKATSGVKGVVTTTCDDCGYVVSVTNIDKTDYKFATSITAIYGQKLKDITIPANIGKTEGSFSWISDTEQSVGAVGVNSFNMRFTPKDTGKYAVEDFSVDVTVTKKQLEPVVSVTRKVRRGLSLGSVSLPADGTEYTWRWKDSTQIVENDGNYKVICKIKSDYKASYEFKDTQSDETERTVSIKVYNESLSYVDFPGTIKAEYNSSLSDIKLPEVEDHRWILNGKYLEGNTTLPNGKYKFTDPSKTIDSLGTYTAGVYFEPSEMGYNNSPSANITITVLHEHTLSYHQSGEDGHYSVCSVCQTQSSISSHEYNAEWTIVKQSTTEEKGSKYKECKVCGYKHYEEIEKLVTTVSKLPIPDTDIYAEFGATLRDVELPSVVNHKWYLGSKEIVGYTISPDNLPNGSYQFVGLSSATLDNKITDKSLIGKTINTTLEFVPDYSVDVFESFTVKLSIRCINHSFGKYISSGENGHYVECSNCGTKQYYSHVMGSLKKCENDVEYHSKTCIHCGYESDKHTHNFERISRKKPTLEEEGYELYRCSDCAAEKTITLEKLALPAYDLPTGLSATYGDTLEDVKFPVYEGGEFIWEDPSLSVGNAGDKTFKAKYVPVNTDNYVTVTGIDVSLHVNRIDKSADDMVIGSIGNKGRVGDAISTVKPFSKYNSTDEDKGTYTWNDPDAVIEMEKRYEVLFVPNDMNNYNWSGSERAKYDPNKGGFVFKLAVAAYESGSDEEVQEINKAALEDFASSVTAIGDVDDSDSCELRIKAARAAYDALSDELKEEVDPLLLEKLQVAEADYNKAKEASTKAKLDKEAAERLVTLAKSIGEIKDCTETTYAKIAEVKKAYAELTDDQKALVSDEVKALIENAENTFNELKKKEAEKEVVEETTAETPVVEPQPEVTPVPTTEEFDPFLPPVTPPKEEPVVEKETIKVGMKISGSGNKVYKVTKFTNKGVGEVAYIGSGKKAKTVTIPATVTYKGINLKVTSIAANAFKGDKKLETVNIGNNIVKIGANAFNGCISLKKVVMGSGVELIDSKAFFNCKSLNLVTINSTVLNKIKTKAFTKAGAKNYKKLVVKTPGSKLNKYKGWLKKAGLNKKCKVKKK